MKKSIHIVFILISFLSMLFIAPIQIHAADAVAISKDGVPISYFVYGQGEPVLIFVHGWSCNRSFWQKQVSYFEKKYRVVTLDLAGHGASGQKRSVYSMKSFGEDVAAVVRAIHAPKVILIGHSMGGAVIIAADEIIPGNVVALIGIDTMQDFEETYSPEQVEEIVKPFKEDFKKATNSFLQSMFVKGTDPKFIDEITATMSNASPRVGISAMEEMFKTSYIANPPKVKAPVWCLNADLWPTKPEINRKYVPEFNLRIMPGVGHFLMLESPDEFNRQLDDIIKKIVKAK
ncbi:MAG: alpha/beta hydrolase [Candidatus Omnitrophica bacterium]|nr:alpha/beta hydrolase [Candidatus Omnitrophota bacterium]